jgi:hypothetical protein
MKDDLKKNENGTRKLIFGMQPYYDPTRKKTSKKNGRRPQKNEMEDDIMTRMTTSKKTKKR